jgi:hypothetical protein
MQSRIVCLTNAGVATKDLPQSARWNWARKLDSVQGMLSHRSLCIVSDELAQALMRLDVLTGRCLHPEQKGLPAVYVDYLEVAPWNLHLPPCGTKRYGLCGSILMSAAVQISVAEEFMGRVVLHSLPQSLGFYQRLGMLDLGADPQQNGLHRLEFTPELAAAFLSERSPS